MDTGLFQISDLFDRYIEDNNTDRPFDGKWHPSSLWGCARAAVLGIRGADKTRGPDAATLRRFWLGHTIHEAVQEAIGAHAKVFYPEFVVDWEDQNIVGAGDGLVQLDDGSWVVIEIKSIAPGGLKKAPLVDHIRQASVYAVAAHDIGVFSPTGEPIPPLGESLRGIIMFYVAKEGGTKHPDAGKTAQFFVEYDKTWRKKIEDRIKYLNFYREHADNLPACMSKDPGEGWRANWCEYYPACEE